MREIQISPEFKKMVTQSIFSIILFLAVYVLLIALSVVLVVLCGLLAFGVVYAFKSFIGIALGLGILAVGLMVFFFMIKFIFSSKKYDTSADLLVTKNDHPKLFKMIEGLVEEIGTEMPKKVYLSPNVTAYVFYNSSFWSMFLPIKKNLNIGLGLVNILTEQELKAVLAHEFGHFSQKSMKIGSYVYYTNHIIHDLLFDDVEYQKQVHSIGNADGIFVTIQPPSAAVKSTMECENKIYLQRVRRLAKKIPGP